MLWKLLIWTKEDEKFIANKNTKTSIYRIQASDSVMSGYFCIRFIDFMLRSKNFFDCANIFSLNKFEKNDKIMLKCFQ